MSDPTTQDAERETSAILAERTWPYVIELKYPVEFGKRTVKALTFQRGKVGMLGDLTLGELLATPTNKLLLIASRLCGEPLGVLESIDPADAMEVLGIAINFINRCQSGGRTAAPS